MDLNTHFMLSIASSAVIATVAVTLAMVHLPRSKGWRRSNAARWTLVASFITLAASGCFKVGDDTRELMSMATICVGSYQALLFAYTATAFVAPLAVTVKRTAAIFAAVTAAVGAVTAIMVWLPQYGTAALVAALAAYCVQLCAHTVRYRKMEAEAKAKLETFYDEDVDHRLRPVNRLFYSALCIGIMAAVFAAIPISNLCYSVFVAIYTLYYVWVGAMVINYFIAGDFFVKAAERQTVSETAASATAKAKPDTDSGATEALNKAIAGWVERRGYTQCDVSTDQIALELGVTRQQLASYFQSTFHTTFRSWRLRLRLEEAQRLIRETPDLKVSQLHEMVGFNDRSNFHNKFVELTGMTPKAYQQKHGSSAD